MTCPFWEEHGGADFNGLWEFYDICHLGADLDCFDTCCSANVNCWYHTKDPIPTIRKIFKAMKNPFARPTYKDGHFCTEYLPEPPQWFKDNLDDDARRIFVTLNAKERELWYYK